MTPTPSPPQSPRSPTKVVHLGQEFWVGSGTNGQGARVQTDTLQKYIDHARRVAQILIFKVCVQRS